MRIQFIELTPEARAAGMLPPDAPAARFSVDGGETRVALAGRISPFTDVRFRHWPATLRSRVLEALCRNVRTCGLAEDGETLDVAGRFEFRPERDEPQWRLQGFGHLATVDLKVIKHVLGVGADDPEHSVGWWSRQLGLTIDAEDLLDRLERMGFTAWQGLRADNDPMVERCIRLYEGVSRGTLVGCMSLLSELRERYMEAVHKVVRDSGQIALARHTHLGTARREVMHLLDDRGILVVAKGSREKSVVATAFDCVVPDERDLGPRSLRRAWIKVVRQIRAGSGMFRIHSPSRWRVA